MKHFIVLLLISLSFNAIAEERVISANFDNLYWHEESKYTLFKINEKSKVEKTKMNRGEDLKIGDNRFSIRKVDLFVDLKNDESPWYSCKYNSSFGSRGWDCEIHISGLDTMKTASWSKTVGDYRYKKTISGTITRLH